MPQLLYARLFNNQGRLRQLKIDHQAKTPVDLKKECCLSAGQYFAEYRNVLQSQLHD
jgi:hypothetical protein